MAAILAPDPTAAWPMSRHGQRLAELEWLEVQRLLPSIFGRVCVQVGAWASRDDWMQACHMPNKLQASLGVGGAADAAVDPNRLPFGHRCADAVFLPHALEFAPHPHALLRECARVLNDRGRLLILGFNPYSLLNLRRRLGLAPRGLPQARRYLALHRLRDWLGLLNFEVVEARRLGVGFPWVLPQGAEAGLTISRALSLGADAYCVLARKRLASITLQGRVADVRPLLVATPAVATSRIPDAQKREERA